MQKQDNIKKWHVPLSDGEFQDIRKIVYSRLGISLTEQKKTLVFGRLQKLLHKLQIKTFREYIEYLLADKSGDALTDFVNRITTNHTFFFREQEHFDFLLQVALPEIIKRKQRIADWDLRIWCAGCSSGEEAYSVLMTLMESLGDDYYRWDAGVLATDISQEVLDTGRAGRYSSESIKGVPALLRDKYMSKTEDGYWVFDKNLRDDITFRRFNLMNNIFPFKKPFDIIICRNVMIYFDLATKQRLLQKFYDYTVDNGYLLVGHSESFRTESCPYSYIKPAIYKKENSI
jgi:chemotaxis protein methyltransferase CheR